VFQEEAEIKTWRLGGEISLPSKIQNQTSKINSPPWRSWHLGGASPF
jgi:hypothetical protein